MKLSGLISATLALLVTDTLAEPQPQTGGELTLRTSEGTETFTTRYRWNSAHLRIDQPGKLRPAPPVNIVDRKSGTIRILRPHNRTWLEIPPYKRGARRDDLLFPPRPPLPQPGMSTTPLAGLPLPPGLPAPPSLPQSAGLAPAINPAPGISPSRGIGPTMLPMGNAAPASAIPPHPPSVPAPPVGAHKLPGVSPGIPPVGTSIPTGTDERTQTLTPHDETRTFHGYACKKYTMLVPGKGNLTLWLSDATGLPPFHRLVGRAPSPHRHISWRERCSTAVRERNFFPMLAVLEHATHQIHQTPQRKQQHEQNPAAPKREIARWEVLSVSQKPFDDQQKPLFEVPDGYHKTEPAMFWNDNR